MAASLVRARRALSKRAWGVLLNWGTNAFKVWNQGQGACGPQGACQLAHSYVNSLSLGTRARKKSSAATTLEFFDARAVVAERYAWPSRASNVMLIENASLSKQKDEASACALPEHSFPS